jgi:DNA polymerase III sliding clamp (beta) subunit (PCNA family)
MLIKRQELLNALEIVKPGLSNKETIPQATFFAFKDGKVITYNDEISISHPVECIDLEGAVKANELYALLSKIKKDVIELIIDNNELRIESKKAKAGLTLQSEIKLPLLDKISKWKKLPETFLKYLSLAIPCCANDTSRPILTCIHIGKEGFIEASDSFKMVRCSLDEQMPIDNFLIPAASAIQVIKLNPISIAESKGWIHFKSLNGTIISCRTFEDTYPNTSHVLEGKGTKLTFPKTILDIVERASVFSKREHVLDESIEITIGNNKIEVSSKADCGWFKEEANIAYDKKPICFCITPYLLKDILAETLECIVCENKLKFEGDNWVYVTMLRGK